MHVYQMIYNPLFMCFKYIYNIEIILFAIFTPLQELEGNKAQGPTTHTETLNESVDRNCFPSCLVSIKTAPEQNACIMTGDAATRYPILGNFMNQERETMHRN